MDGKRTKLPCKGVAYGLKKERRVPIAEQLAGVPGNIPRSSSISIYLWISCVKTAIRQRLGLLAPILERN